MGSLFEKMHLLFFPLLFLLLCSRAKAGEVIGGTECKPHSRPYMAYVEIVTSSGHQGTCGGLLIRRNFVLTAAHCAGRSLKVNLGVHNKNKKEDSWQSLKVVKQFPHPDYSNCTFLHDIMLLKLEKKANLTLAVGTLPLPPQFNFIPSGRVCRAAGWGKTGREEPSSDTLQEVKLRLMEPQACRHFTHFNYHFQLCVGNPRKRKSVFKGDSGGPLLCAGIAEGIASYAHRNAKPPVVFTRISYYRPWINKILKEHKL